MYFQEIPNAAMGTVIDVRTQDQYYLMQAPNTTNIPLGLLLYSLDELKDLPKPWIFVCDVGQKSGRAVWQLKTLGYTEVYNGGQWHDLPPNTKPSAA
jgi:phage shock protein E